MKSVKSKCVIVGLFLIAALTSCTTTRVATLSKSENDKIELFTTKFPDKII